MSTNTTPARTVAINLRQIAVDAAIIADAADRVDGIGELLRDLADLRVPLPDRATLGERLREAAAELEQALQEIETFADSISGAVADALDDEDDGGLDRRHGRL